MTKDDFIRKSIFVHGDKYDYSKVYYTNNKTKVCIICPEHGEFWVTPNHHLRGVGCKKCSIKSRANKRSFTNEEFIKKAKEIHGNKYNYSKVEYVNSTTKVCIICPKHGEFWQVPSSHLNGAGCKKCAYENISDKNTYTREDFIKESMLIHNNKYDYSKANYINCRTKICVICPKHGEFWQLPYIHLQGKGCPDCQNSLLEEKTSLFLGKNNVFNIHRCDKKYLNWIGTQHLDFYLPEYNVAIECQGIQHFKPVDFFGGKQKFNYQVKNDIKKKQLCEKYGVKLYYINYDENVEDKLNKILKNICHL